MIRSGIEKQTREILVSWAPAAGWLLTALLFVGVKWWFSAPRFSDGNVYIYLARLVAEGKLPYRDFFYSSPPLLLYFYAAWGKIFGFGWAAFNMLAAVLSVAEAGLIYLVVKRWSAGAGMLAAAMYLVSFVVLATSDFASDVHVVTTLVLLAVLAQVNKRPAWAGVVAGLAVLTKLYAVVPAVGLLAAWGWRRRWREAVIFLVSGGLTVGVALGLVWLLTGGSFFSMVFLSHVGKIAGLSRGRILAFFLGHDPLLAVGIALAVWQRRRLPVIIWAPLVFLFVFLIGFQDVYYLYFKLLAVFLVLAWGWALAGTAEEFGGRKFLAAGLVVLALAAGGGGWRYLTEQARAAVIEGMAEITKMVEQRTAPGEIIYGDFEVTPLVALAAGRPLWRGLADTNSKFFQTGYFDYEERGRELTADRVRVIVTKGLVTKGGRVLGGQERVAPPQFFSENCQATRVFPVARDYTHNAVVVWECRY